MDRATFTSRLVPMSSCTRLSTAMSLSNDEERKFMEDEDRAIKFCEIVSALLWPAPFTRPDIMYTMYQLSKYNSNVHNVSIVQTKQQSWTKNTGTQWSKLSDTSKVLSTMDYVSTVLHFSRSWHHNCSALTALHKDNQKANQIYLNTRSNRR